MPPGMGADAAGPGPVPGGADQPVSVEDDRAPICPYCGVTALPADAGHVLDTRFACEHPECEAFGEIVPAL